MAENSKLPAGLVHITDVFGMSAPAKRLIEAIAHGVGEWAYPWQSHRKAKADAKALRTVTAALKKEGLAIETAQLTLEDRALMRLTAQIQRQQQNREEVALHAIEEFNILQSKSSADKEATIDFAWLDRF